MVDSPKLKIFGYRQNPPGFSVLGGILILLLSLSYAFYAREAGYIDYEIFDLGKNVSWEKSEQGIYRVEAKGDFEVFLLSRDTWRDFDISFRLTHPRKCGFVFNYQDEKNYDLVYFNATKDALNLLAVKEGAVHPVRDLPVHYGPQDSYALRVKNDLIRFFLNEKPILEIPLSYRGGQIGFLLRDALEPKTYFNNIAVSGHLSDGRFMSSDPKRSSPVYKTFLAVIQLYLFLLAAGVYLAVIFRRFLESRCSRAKNIAPVKGKGGINIYTASLVHLAVTIFIFHPFVFRGHILVSSTDNFGEILPLFLLSKHNFWDIIRGYSLCLWNPYNHNGLPFFASHWNMIYYPLNWIVFLFSDKIVFSVLTLRVFLEVFLLGICAYGFFAIELGSRPWALFCSIVYQLCSFLIFGLTIFPAVSLFFSMTLYLYLLWSMPVRRSFWNFLWLSISVVFILTSANVAFVFYAVLSLLILSAYRILTLRQETKCRVRDFLLVGASLLTGLLIAAIRLVPCAYGIADSNRIVQNYFTIHDRLFMVARLFVPEIAGQYGLNVLSSENLNFVYKHATIAANDHNTFFVYFGVLPALLLLLNVFIKSEGHHRFWKIYSFTALAIGLLCQPFWGIFSILFFPFNHHLYQIIILPVGLCTLMGYTGMSIEKNRVNINKVRRNFIISLLLIQSLMVVIVTYLFPRLTPYARILFIVTIVWVAGDWIFKKYNHRIRGLFLFFSQTVGLGLLWVLAFSVSTAALAKPIATKETVIQFFNIPFIFLLSIVLTAAYIYVHVFRKGKTGGCKFILSCGVAALIPVAACWILGSSFFRNFLNIPTFDRVYAILMGFGEIHLFLILFIGIAGVTFYRIGILSKNSFVFLFIVVTAFELLLFNARFDNICAPTPSREVFYEMRFPYSDMDERTRTKLDLINYRCDLLNRTGLNKNKNVIFKVPSYTGAFGYMSKRFTRFINNFGYPEGTILIYPGDLPESERLLDLSAVRYIFGDQGDVIERPSALSRLTLFYSYEVIKDDDKLLSLLKDPSFNFREKILLNQKPELVNLPAVLKSEFVPIRNATSDKVAAEVVVRAPAILLFCDSYADGWKAYVDGKEAPLYTANYNFMACPVNPGGHKIEFKFEPPVYFLARKTSLFGIVVLFAGMLILIFKTKGSRKK